VIRSLLVALATSAATTISAGPVGAKELQQPRVVTAAAAKLRLATARADFRDSQVYIVRMAAKPAASYKGGLSGFARTAPALGRRYDARSGEAEAYARLLKSQHDALLASVGAGSERKLYSYVHTLNGFAARLTPAEAAKLRKDPRVIKVWEDRLMPLATNNSPRFLGLLHPENGLRSALGLTGKGVIIGVIDTGVVQEHPSFADTNFTSPPARWSGICQVGERWSSSDCTDKLIGARWFVDGFMAGGDDLADGEFLSARDSDGHGTHTASTAGGNRVQASLNGAPLTYVSGMATRARIAVYKSCWIGSDFTTPADDGCFFSDSAAAADAAVADGVDVISFSVGTDAAFDDPMDLALLGAFDAGVVVARSAGNEGPGDGTTAAGEPWSITVAASTQRGTSYAQATRVNAPVSVAGDYPSLEGAITKPLAESGDLTAGVQAAQPIRACGPIAPVSGIALIGRGTCDFTVKIRNAVNAGASGVIVYTDDRPKVIMGGTATPATRSIPGVMVDREVGLALLAEINDSVTVNATLSPSNFLEETMTGNIMAGFSSRGPFATEPSWIKPDVTAPGVQILAGGTPELADGSSGDFFQYLDGTSMSTPHVAGIAALLREAHPEWSPAAVKSALMTTARTNLKKEDGVSRPTPFDFGSGHIAPNLAVDPGLVYDSDLSGYQAASCGTVTPLVGPDDCELLGNSGHSLDPADLNLASIGVADVLGARVVRRTVTNVSDTASTYTATVTPPGGFRVVVEPSALTLGPGESASFEVRIRNRAAPPGAWRFGSLVWSDGTHSVRSPIALNARLLTATPAIEGAGAAGSASIDVAFGYTGAYTAGAHGLLDPDLSVITVADDPDNSFDQTFGPDEVIVGPFPTAAGTTYAQWSTYDEYTDGTHDMDLYLYYCPSDESQPCTIDGQSFSFTSTETVRAIFPKDDGTANDAYYLVIHGYETEDGTNAKLVLFTWADPGAAADAGNMTVIAPASAKLGQSGTVDVSWAGLDTGAGAKQVGAISHSGDAGPVGATTIEIANDAGAGFCNLAKC
jgi:subtilisin family serine protease